MTSDLLSRPQTHRPSSGSLRDTLIEAGMKLVLDGGLEALTLRRTAALAGVSHAAPAHHFDGLSGLLTAIAARAFSDFSASMISAREAADQTPFGRLAGVCEGYLAFSRDRAGLFRLMFTSATLDRRDTDFAVASKAAYDILREACAPFASSPPEELELSVWSAVHGYALLELDRNQAEGRVFGAAPPFRSILQRLVRP